MTKMINLCGKYGDSLPGEMLRGSSKENNQVRRWNLASVISMTEVLHHYNANQY